MRDMMIWFGKLVQRICRPTPVGSLRLLAVRGGLEHTGIDSFTVKPVDIWPWTNKLILGFDTTFAGVRNVR